MIRHIVMFSVKDTADVPFILDTLRGYASIPGVEALEVERNERRDAWSNEMDLVLHATFRDRAALEAYKRHPIYERGTKAVRPLRELRFAADFESDLTDAGASTAHAEYA